MWKSGDLGISEEEGHLRVTGNIMKFSDANKQYNSMKFIFVTGRIKELIITQGGKNIAPVPIEDSIKSKLPKIISQAVLVGDNKKYVSCIFTLQVAADPQTMLPTEILDPGAVSWCKDVLQWKCINLTKYLSVSSSLTYFIR